MIIWTLQIVKDFFNTLKYENIFLRKKNIEKELIMLCSNEFKKIGFRILENLRNHNAPVAINVTNINIEFDSESKGEHISILKQENGITTVQANSETTTIN